MTKLILLALMAVAMVVVVITLMTPAQAHVEGVEVNVDEQNFATEVLESPTPVLVDFGATWCGPCRMLEPVVAQLSLDMQGELKVAKVDTDESPRLAEEYVGQGIPTLVLIRDGEVIADAVGYRDLDDLTDWVNQWKDAPAMSQN